MHLSVSWSQLVCCDAKIILVSHLQEVYMYLYFSQFIIYSLILSIFVRVCNSSFKCQWIHISGDSRKHEHVWMAAHIFQALLHWEVRMIGGGDFWWDLLLVHCPCYIHWLCEGPILLQLLVHIPPYHGLWAWRFMSRNRYVLWFN